MSGVKYILLILSLIVISFFFGNFLEQIFKRQNRKIVNSFLLGLLFFFSVYQLEFTAYYFLGNTNFTRFYILFLVTIISIFVLACVFFFKNKEYQKYSESFNKINVVKISLASAAIILVLIQGFCTCYLYHEDADDGYFITASTIAIQQDEIQLESNLVYSGRSETEEAFRAETSGWEILVATFSKTTDIEPAILAHSLLPVFLIGVCYVAYYHLFSKLFKNEYYSLTGIIVLSVISLFSGYSIYLSGAFLLLRIWQGKAMIPNFIFPLLLASCIDIINKNEDKLTWITNAFILLSGIMFSVVGVYLTPILYAFYGLPYFFSQLFKNLKRAFKILFCAILSVVPMIPYVVNTLSRLYSLGSGVYLVEHPQQLDWMQLANNEIGSNYIYLAIIIVAAIIILLRGNKTDRYFLLLVPICIFATALNPKFIDFVSSRITGWPVYWRLFWFIPDEIIIVVATILLIKLFKKYIYVQSILVFAIIIGIAYAGTNVYQNELLYQPHTNAYKLPDDVLEIVDYLNSIRKNDYTTVFTTEFLSTKIRQYDSTYDVVKAREITTDSRLIGDSGVSYQQLYNTIFNEANVSDPAIQNALNVFGVQYIISDKPLLTTDNIVQICVNDESTYYIYNVVQPVTE